MHSIAQAIALTDAVQESLHHAKQTNADKVLSPEQRKESDVARQKVLQTLRSCIGLIETALQGSKMHKTSRKHKSKVPVKELVANGVAPLSDSLGFASTDPVDIFRQSFYGAGLGGSNETLSQMADAIAPITDAFGSVLDLPYIDQWSATLNLVPVIGIRDRAIMFVNSTYDATTNNTVDDWALFSMVPPGVTLDSSKQVHFFPYKGDFCFSAGADVWKKSHRQPSGQDPQLSSAIDNWPKMYVDDWTSVGTSILPASDVLSVVPFSVIDGADIGFKLVSLMKDGTLKVMDGDTMQSGQTWTTMQYNSTTSSPSSQPQFVRATYFAGLIHAYDVQNQLWEVTPNWIDHSFTIASAQDPASGIPVTEFTADEEGLLAARADGMLYKRLVKPAKDNSENTATTWSPWIPLKGVSSLGVASPGVILDLKLVTRTLLRRYITTQTALYPVVENIKSFTEAHAAYLQQLLATANQWAAASTDAQRDLAIKAGASLIVHAQTWSASIHQTIQDVVGEVIEMAAQLGDIHEQLQTQLRALQDKLKTLHDMLDEDNEALHRLEAIFYAGIGAIIGGIFSAFIGTVFPPAFVFAGVLLAGGLACLVASQPGKIGELRGEISDLTNQIDTTNQSTTQLSRISNTYTDLNKSYKELEGFWGGMSNDAAALSYDDANTKAELGMKTLADTSSIEIAITISNTLNDACTKYLQVINKQGVIIPKKTQADDNEREQLVKGQEVLARCIAEHQADAQMNLSIALEFLKQGDIEHYEELLVKAMSSQILGRGAQRLLKASTGVWFDVPALISAGSLWDAVKPKFLHVGALSDDANLDNEHKMIIAALATAEQSVIPLVQNILSLAETMQSWSSKYPKLPDSAHLADAKSLQQDALKKCQEASNISAQANNDFASFNVNATNYQHDATAQVSYYGDQVQRLQAQKQADVQQANDNYTRIISSLPPPLPRFPIPDLSRIYQAWKDEVNRINQKYDSQTSALDNAMQGVRDSIQSGLNVQGKSATWITMVQDVSGNLGSIHNLLVDVKGMIWEDPAVYANIIGSDWSRLIKDANQVLDILQAHVSSTISRKLLQSSHSHYSHSSHGLMTTSDPNLVQALLPTSNLSQIMVSQADKAAQSFEQLDQVLQLPYTSSIIVSWNDDKTSRSTLADVTSSLRRQYTFMLGEQYSSIEKLYALSMVQAQRARDVVNRGLVLDVFVANTIQTLSAARNAAQTTKTQYGKTAADFDKLMRKINDDAADLTKQIDGITDKINDADKQLRKEIGAEVGVVIALCFATGALAAAFGPEGPAVATAIDIATKVTFAAGAIGSAVGLVVESMNVNDLIALIDSLKESRSTIQANLDALATVQPALTAVVESVDDMATEISAMVDDLTNIYTRVDWGSQFLTEADVKQMGDAWHDVTEGCVTWLQTANKQGIRPLSLIGS